MGGRSLMSGRAQSKRRDGTRRRARRAAVAAGSLAVLLAATGVAGAWNEDRASGEGSRAQLARRRRHRVPERAGARVQTRRQGLQVRRGARRSTTASSPTSGNRQARAPPRRRRDEAGQPAREAADARPGRRALARRRHRAVRHGLRRRHDRPGPRQDQGLPAQGRPGRAPQQQLRALREPAARRRPASDRHAARPPRARPAQQGAVRGSVRHRHDASDHRANMDGHKFATNTQGDHQRRA